MSLGMRLQLTGRGCWLSAALVALAIIGLSPSPASAAARVGWAVKSIAEPTDFSPNDATICHHVEGSFGCDRYQLLVTNTGDEKSGAPITLTDQLPPGITTLRTPRSGEDGAGTQWSCTEEAGNPMVTCTFPDAVAAGGYAPFLEVLVSAPTASMATPLRNEVSVSGGGAASATTVVEQTPISFQAPPFELKELTLEPLLAGGGAAESAGAHPWEITTSFQTPSVINPAGAVAEFRPAETWKDVLTELPPGLVGDPQATPRCTALELEDEGTALEGKGCPPASAVGEFAVIGGLNSQGNFTFTGWGGSIAEGGCCSMIYNMVPQRGYPAEFAFIYAGVPVHLYSEVVHTASGYHLRVSAPRLPSTLENFETDVTFFGDPGRLNEGAQGATDKAFLTNPTGCGGPLNSRIELDTWEDPTHELTADDPSYTDVTGCNELQFQPTISVGTDSNGTNIPAALSFDLHVPQTLGFEERATPELRDVTVKLPQGLDVNPSSANGLVACREAGPEGINIGSTEIGAKGQDIGDPEAVELGEGHEGGNSSPYDDGLYHTAPGDCPPASTLGSVEVSTPLLSEALRGHIYLGQPACSPCSDSEAAEGKLVRLYIEVAGSGVIVKLPGTVSIDPSTGQLTSRFPEDPELPFEDLKLQFNKGPRASLVNPQSCASYTATSDLEPWSAPETPDATPSSSFPVTEDCNAHGFAPSFSAGMINTQAGGFSPFTLTLSRTDVDQDFNSLSVTTPPGLLGVISGVPLCGEPQASQGACPSSSQIGHVTVGSGPGPDPVFVPQAGRPEDPVYLTGPYKGAPFGLSVVVPAEAGPFNLGTVVVRSAITVDRTTGQITISSDPFPTILDGIPLQIKTINVTVDRGEFMFNPSNCSTLTVNATVSSTQNAQAAVSSPFQAANCASLPFKPSLTISTQGKTSKADGASLEVKLSQKPGEANIHKVDLTIPLVLPSRLTTLQKACLEAQFNVNPAGCPEASDIGTATAHTPLLQVPLTGPAYLVSHGGAEFPDVEFVLQADERGGDVEIVLDGSTDIKKGITYSRFEAVPDAPITSFESSFPEGPHSVFAANANLCALTKTVTVEKRVTLRREGRTVHVLRKVKKQVPEPLVVPSTLTGQNGAVINQNTKVVVTECAKAKPKKVESSKRRAKRKKKT
jgi:hypothetical protein